MNASSFRAFIQSNGHPQAPKRSWNELKLFRNHVKEILDRPAWSGKKYAEFDPISNQTFPPSIFLFFHTIFYKIRFQLGLKLHWDIKLRNFYMETQARSDCWLLKYLPEILPERFSNVYWTIFAPKCFATAGTNIAWAISADEKTRPSIKYRVAPIIALPW